MARLYIHRVEPVEKDGKIILEKVPEKPEQENMGVKYRIEIKQLDQAHAKAYGWNTGYPLPCDEGSQGRVYAPDGFKKGKFAFVDINDELLSVSKMDSPSLDVFLANLAQAEIKQAIDTLQCFSLMGEILQDLL